MISIRFENQIRLLASNYSDSLICRLTNLEQRNRTFGTCGSLTRNKERLFMMIYSTSFLIFPIHSILLNQLVCVVCAGITFHPVLLGKI